MGNGSSSASYRAAEACRCVEWWGVAWGVVEGGLSGPFLVVLVADGQVVWSKCGARFQVLVAAQALVIVLCGGGEGGFRIVTIVAPLCGLLQCGSCGIGRDHFHIRV